MSCLSGTLLQCNQPLQWSAVRNMHVPVSVMVELELLVGALTDSCDLRDLCCQNSSDTAFYGLSHGLNKLYSTLGDIPEPFGPNCDGSYQTIPSLAHNRRGDTGRRGERWGRTVLPGSHTLTSTSSLSHSTSCPQHNSSNTIKTHRRTNIQTCSQTTISSSSNNSRCISCCSR